MSSGNGAREAGGDDKPFLLSHHQKLIEASGIRPEVMVYEGHGKTDAGEFANVIDDAIDELGLRERGSCIHFGRRVAGLGDSLQAALARTRLLAKRARTAAASNRSVKSPKGGA